MGRNAGFITMEACLASGDVDICLIPESKYNLFGENGVLCHIEKILRKKHTCVIVVAEGALDSALDYK